MAHREHFDALQKRLDPLGLFNKDGAGTIALEMLPFGGFVAAPFHHWAGNDGHAAAALAGGVLSVAMPGVGGVLLKGAGQGLKALVARQGIKAAGKVAVTAGKKGLQRAAVNSGAIGAAKVGIKHGVNAIKKHRK